MRTCITLAGLAILGPVPALAEGLVLGRSEFYPSLSFSLGDDDNVFSRSDVIREDGELVANEVIGDRYAEVNAPLIWRLPFRQSHWQFGYTPGMYLYQDQQELNGYKHDVRSELELNFSNQASLIASGGVLFDYLNTSVFGAQEIVFNAANYRVDTANIDYEQPLNARHGFGLGVAYENLSFDRDVARTFYDYRKRAADASYINFLAADLRLVIEGGLNANDQDRTTFESDEDGWDGWSLRVGVERRFDDRNRAGFFLAYEELAFRNSDDSDFRGFLPRFLYQRAITSAFHIQATLDRTANQSVYNVNNYYVTDRVAVRTFARPGSKFFYTLAAAYQRNHYPDIAKEFCAVDASGDRFEPVEDGGCVPNGNGEIVTVFSEEAGVRREDSYFLASVGIGFNFTRTTALQLTVDHRDRNSNIPTSSFDGNRVLLEFRFGWAPDREFI